MKKSKSAPPGGGVRDWSAYNKSQTNEKTCFLQILQALCQEVEPVARIAGRKPIHIRDVIFCLVLKVYSTLSARRFQDDLLEVQTKGFVEVALSATSISEYMRCASLYATLQHLLIKSSLPLSEDETVFAADSTGFSIPRRRIWFNKHTNRRVKRRDFMKLHVMVGVKTNIITYAEASEGSASDMNYLRQLVEGTARYFEISEVSADAGYLSGENMYTVLLKGGIPYFAFKKNCALDANYKSTLWKDLLYLCKTRHPLFTEHYFRRNNVEASFQALKARFGGRLRSKSQAGQFNEALAKALCHNICMLIRAMYVSGIDPLAWAGKVPKARPQGASLVETMAKRKEDLLAIRQAAGNREMPVPQAQHKPARRAPMRKGKSVAPDQVRLFD